MDVHVQRLPPYAMAIAQLEPGEAIQVEASSMVGMSIGEEVETKARGGLLKSLARSMLGGESFFLKAHRASERGCFPHLAHSQDPQPRVEGLGVTKGELNILIAGADH